MKRIKRIISDTTIWPNVSAHEVEIFSDDDNSIYTATLPAAEVNLALHIKWMVSSGKLNQVDVNSLFEKIEEYGSMKYNEGSADVLIPIE